MKIRMACESDIDAMLAIKNELRFQETERSTSGGFLLGTDAQGYRERIATASTWVLDDGEVQGFAIVMPDATFRRSEVWARREAVCWDGIDLAAMEQESLCYFDQLAVRRGGFGLKKWGAALALRAVVEVVNQGHSQLVTATVSEPVLNLAAVPYLKRLGGRCVGRLDEFYDVIGPLVSDIWLVSRESLSSRLRSPRGLAERWVCDAAKGEWA